MLLANPRPNRSIPSLRSIGWAAFDKCSDTPINKQEPGVHADVLDSRVDQASDKQYCDGCYRV